MFRLFSSGVDDLVLVSNPSNGEVTSQIGARFDRELIYTNIGEVLIAVNPYKALPITGPEFIKMYQNASGSDASPHIYALAERAYRRMVDENESQCVIISGESGAGKTVSAKLILQYVTSVSPNNSSGGGSGGSGGGNGGIPQYDGGSDDRPSPPMGRGMGMPGMVGRGGLPTRGGGPPSRGGGPPPTRGRGGPPPPIPQNRGAPPPVSNGGGAPPPVARGPVAPPPTRGAPPTRGGPANRGGRGGGPPPPVSSSRGGGGYGGSSKTVDVEHIKKVILDSNPLMEAIGNAKTVRNDNSSRFGKYLEIQFDDNNAPVGGLISTFLLEKTRVTFQQKNERNFHIFYQMLGGLDQTTKSEWGLTQATDFYYLAQSKCTTVEDVDDSKDFHEVKAAMETVGISRDEQTEIFRILAAILHVGNIRFQGEAPASVIDETPLQWAASLLGCDPTFLCQSLNHRQIQSGSARHTQYQVPQNPDQSAGLRDALAKTLYERIFDFIVVRVNKAMSFSGNCKVIGVLDIYGFEVFERNSFEQFCINYVNERLQQIFIDLTVRGEQREYHEEGMKWKDISFFDNKIVVDLIDGNKPPGIMRVLDDVCKTVHAVDSAAADIKFMEKLIHSIQSHPHLVISNTGSSADEFTIKHYAGEVSYSIEEFCFKNNDNLYASIVGCLQNSTYQFIVSLFPENIQDNKQAPTTSSFKIRQSSSYLVTRLSACTPHYIRCIKPNDKKQPMNFVSSRVEHQVKYLGILENIKVKRSGYAYRQLKDIFLNRFGKIMDVQPRNVQEFVEYITRTHKDINADEFEEGKTKVFVKNPETIFVMEDLLMQKIDPIGYKNRVQAYKENEKLAQMKQDSKYVKEIHSNEATVIYILDNSNNLWAKNTTENFESKHLIKSIPLENPKILGSFSNDTLFIIGSKYQELNYDYKIFDPLFKPILLISNYNNYHYSMNIQDDGKSINCYSMTTKRNQGIDYFSIEIENLNIKDSNFENVINLKNSTNNNNKLFKTNISVDSKSIESFKFSHDKYNDIYRCLIKEKETNNTWIVSLEKGSIGMFKVDMGVVNFDNIIFVSKDYKSMMFSYTGNHSNLMAVSCDLKNNITNIEEMVLQSPNNSYQIISDSYMDFMFLSCKPLAECFLHTFSSIDFSFISTTRLFRLNLDSNTPLSINSVYYVFRRNRIVLNDEDDTVIIAILVPIFTFSLVVLVALSYYFIVVKNKSQNKQKEKKLESVEIPKDIITSGADFEID
ncbi:hypothetical protein ACTFIW_003961 [Dictyostelium discoideum]